MSQQRLRRKWKKAYDAWQGDPKQQDILTDCDAKAIGVGVVAAGDGTTYWTADFGG